MLNLDEWESGAEMQDTASSWQQSANWASRHCRKMRGSRPRQMKPRGYTNRWAADGLWTNWRSVIGALYQWCHWYEKSQKCGDKPSGKQVKYLKDVKKFLLKPYLTAKTSQTNARHVQCLKPLTEELHTWCSSVTRWLQRASQALPPPAPMFLLPTWNMAAVEISQSPDFIC